MKRMFDLEGAPTQRSGSALPLALRFVEHVRHGLPGPLVQLIYRLPLVNTMIRHQLNMIAPSGLREVAIAGGFLRGAHVSLDLRSEKYYWLGIYEPPVLQAIIDFVTSGMVVYDVGANIGFISLALARAVGTNGRVYAFEPLPANLDRLTQNIALNACQDIIHPIPYAVSDCAGPQEFYVHNQHAMGRLAGSSGRDTTYICRAAVSALTLDDFVYRANHQAPDLIKIDIEGGATKAIPGMVKVLSEFRPIILAELHGPEEQQVIWTALKQNGYTVHKMQPGYPEIACLSSFGWKQYVVAKPPNHRLGQAIHSGRSH